MTTRILLADDHALIRKGLRSLLDEQPDFEVVAEAVNGREAVTLAGELRPDVVVMDVGMPDLNGIEAAREIHAAAPAIKIVALSMLSEPRMVQRMADAGASAYVLKDCAFDELSRSIREVLDGRGFVTGGVAGPGESPAAAATDLTARERHVLQLLAEGHSTVAIAGRLEISGKTVETHRLNIKRKLNLSSLAELTKFAIREGLTSLDT